MTLTNKDHWNLDFFRLYYLRHLPPKVVSGDWPRVIRFIKNLVHLLEILCSFALQSSYCKPVTLLVHLASLSPPSYMIALKSQIRLRLLLSLLKPRHRLECTRIHATTLLGWFLFWIVSLFYLDIPTSCSILFSDFKTLFGFCCRTLPSICRKIFLLQWEIAKNTQNNPFWVFEGYRKWHLGCPNQNSKTTFQYKHPP